MPSRAWTLAVAALLLALVLFLWTRTGTRPGRKARPLLVCDLDETLVHSTPLQSGDFLTEERPGARAFLTRAARTFDLAIFTASTQPYADPIIDTLERGAGVRFARRLYRESCTVKRDGTYVKDLSLAFPSRFAVLLDNTPTVFEPNPPERCVAIESWFGDPSDLELAPGGRVEEILKRRAP